MSHVHHVSHAANIFRLAGDLVHLLSIILLWMKISRSRSCSGKKSGMIICNIIALMIVSFHSFHSFQAFL